MPLIDAISVIPPDGDEEVEDIFAAAPGLIFPDDTVNMHGDGRSTLVFHSSTFGDIRLKVADPQQENERRLFAHALWNAGIKMAMMISEESDENWNVKGSRILELGAGVNVLMCRSGLYHMLLGRSCAGRRFRLSYPTLAGSVFKKDNTIWSQYAGNRKAHALGTTKEERLDLSGYPGFGEYSEEDVHDYVGASHKSKKFAKTPKIPRGRTPDSCRVYGTIHGNKVHGDFHITARGHGYMEFGQHLDHSSFNFSHQVNELSFGPYYPSLTNPLDNTYATTDAHFYKFQYYLSVVPTIYTTDAKSLRKIDKYHESPTSGEDGLSQHPKKYSKNTVFTNQYAVTEQSHPVPENAVPGVFVKFDIEPIQLTIAENWSSVPALFIRIVNVVSGLLVAGGWCFQISEWAREVYGRKRQRGESMGMLNGNHFTEKQSF